MTIAAPSTALSHLTASVSLVVDHGGKTTPEYDRLVSRWKSWADGEYRPTEALAAAVIGDAPAAELDTLTGLALVHVSSTTISSAKVSNEVAAHVLRHLRDEVQKTAPANYRTVAKKFDEAAARFVSVLSKTDPRITTEALVTRTKAEREAWLELDEASTSLDTILPALHAAASLAGYSHPDSSKSNLIALSLKTDGVHRRVLWEAWDELNVRGGRWTSVTEAGASIAAHAPSDITPYREPAPLETKYERRGMGYVPVVVDPEDRGAGTATLTATQLAQRVSR